MKTTKTLLLIALAFVLAPALVFAAPVEYTDGLWYYSSHTGEADGPAGTFLAYGGAKPMGGSQACVTFANVTSDLASARLFSLTETGDETTVDVAVAASNNTVPVTATASLTLTAGAGSWVMLYDTSTGYAEVDRISSGTAATNIVLVGTTDHAYTTATRVIELEAAGPSALVANTTVTFTGDGVLCGKRGEALGWYLDGTSACRIGTLTGTYR